MDDKTLKDLLDTMSAELKRGFDAGGNQCARCPHAAMTVPAGGGYAQQYLSCANRDAGGDEISIRIEAGGKTPCGTDAPLFEESPTPIRVMFPVRWDAEGFRVAGMRVPTGNTPNSREDPSNAS